MFSAFWESAYDKFYDGANTLMPAVHIHVDMALFPILGTIFYETETTHEVLLLHMYNYYFLS